MKEYYPQMSEGNKSPDKISRRDFNKLAGAVLAGIGLGGAGYAGWKTLEGLGLHLKPQEPPSDNFFYEESQKLARATQSAATPTPFQPEPNEEATPEPSPTPEAENYWKFAKIDFSNSKEPIDMGFFIGSDTILVPSFTPFVYYEGALEDGAFSPEINSGMAYLDSSSRKVLNLHSGRRGPLDAQGFTMWGMQRYLEEDPNNGVRRYPKTVNEIISQSLIGSEVVIRQGKISSLVKIAAALRVPPTQVAESQSHVYDISDWLGKTYPNSGFADLGNGKDTLVIKFCGRILSGERADESRPSYQQSRFFIALKS